MFSYDENPRALIFARDEHTVTDMASLYKLMRWVKHTQETDPLLSPKLGLSNGFVITTPNHAPGIISSHSIP